MGGERTAYWPNYPVKMPFDLGGFDGLIQTSGFLVPGKKEGKLEVYDITNNLGPFNLASKADDGKSWSYHWVVFKGRFFVPGADSSKRF